MATKNATKPATKKTSPKSAPKKSVTTTKVTTVKAAARLKSTPQHNAGAASMDTGRTSAFSLNNTTLNIVIAEVVGTFILVMVALLTLQNVMPLYLGLTVALLVMSIGAVSGAHVNPAVTFGLWSVRRLKSALLPFYWGAQFIGAMAAVVVTNLMSSNSIALDFGNFASLNWGIFMVELIGTAVFIFGLTALTDRADLSSGTKAVGVGLSFFAGILVASSLFASVQSGIDQSKIGVEVDEKTGQQKLSNVPHELRVKGATLNPAIALASTEQTDSQLQSGAVGEGEKQSSRLSLEVLLSTLIGAALGANLARLMGRRFKA